MRNPEAFVGGCVWFRALTSLAWKKGRTVVEDAPDKKGETEYI